MLIVESFDLSIVLNYGTVHIIKDVLIIDINIGMRMIQMLYNFMYLTGVCPVGHTSYFLPLIF